MEEQRFRYLDLVMAGFVTVLLVSNIVSAKITRLWVFTFDAGTLLFPISYIFGDILTEVYGYSPSRRVIWTGFFANLVMSGVLILVGRLPPAPGWGYQEAYLRILGLTPRIVCASLIAYWLGAFANSFVLAKLKIFTRGHFLWSRTIGSTVVGQGIDTFLFVGIAFLGVLTPRLLWSVAISNYFFKVGVEVLATPITYRVVNFLKQREGVDAYDYRTNFTPFRWS